MKHLSRGVLAAVLFSAPVANAQDVALDTDAAVFSYGIGMRTAQSMMSEGLDPTIVIPDAFAQAMKDVFAGAPSRVSDAEMEAAVAAISVMLREKAEADAKAAAAAGVAFLEQNGTVEGIQTTASGLQYRIDVQGDGSIPKASDTVSVHYSGRLLDGTQFDSSYDRGEPAQFPVGGVIPGWTEVLQIMPVGSTYEIWLPHEIGYGPRGSGPVIPPFAVLNFTVQLLDIVSE